MLETKERVCVKGVGYLPKKLIHYSEKLCNAFGGRYKIGCFFEKEGFKPTINFKKEDGTGLILGELKTCGWGNTLAIEFKFYPLIGQNNTPDTTLEIMENQLDLKKLLDKEEILYNKDYFPNLKDKLKKLQNQRTRIDKLVDRL